MTKNVILPNGQKIACAVTSFADFLRKAEAQDGLRPSQQESLRLDQAREALRNQPDPDELLGEIQERERLAEAAKAHLFDPQTPPPPKQSERDRQISLRNLRFQQVMSDLRKDFDISPSKTRQITPFSGYVPSEALTGDYCTIAIRGGLGSGKTQATLEYLKRLGGGAVWIAGRNQLLRDTQTRAILLKLAVHHFQDDVVLGRELLRDGLDGTVLFMAYASLSEYHFHGVDWSDKIVVIDEFQSVRKEILRTPKLLPEFQRMLRECKQLIVADAFLSDVDLRVIGLYRKGKRLILKQTHTPDPTPLKWIECLNKEGEISMTHEAAYLPLVRQWVREGLSVAIASDSATVARVLFDALTCDADGRFSVSGWLTWSKAIEANHELLSNVNGNLDGVRLWIFTPSAQNGIDCQVRFDRVLVIANGILPPTQILQMAKRVRNAGEIWVSAPRKTVDPASVTIKLDGDRIKSLGQKLASTFDENGDNPSEQAWGVWERATSQIEAAFNSEYVKALFCEYFANVETVEIGQSMQNAGEWRSRVDALKNGDSIKLLTADVETGKGLLTLEKQPKTEAEAWAVEAAHLDRKWHKLFKRLRTTYNPDGEEATNAQVVSITRQLMSKRVDKLKNWRIADVCNPTDDEMLNNRLTKGRITYAAPGVIQRQNIALYRLLRLKQLANLTKAAISEAKGQQNGMSVVIADKCAFTAKSKVIETLWYQFRNSSELRALFPEVESQQAFWEVVKRCMSFMGHQRQGQNIRVETDGVLVPNGKDRKGRQRYTRSESRYFVGFKPVEESGGKVFQAIFPELLECIDELLEQERRDYLQWLKPPQWGFSHTPPGAGVAA